MTTSTKLDHDASQARGALWAGSLFYVLIAFEFFYMASPFAAYFYAVYGPSLDWLQNYPVTSWLIQFFLPHLVEETRSTLVNRLEIVGIVLFFGGIIAFVIGAVQVYGAKLRRRDAVMGGLYRHIRHPQYLALIVAAIGMLLVWPRFLVLLGTITVIFIYIALARVEEGICLRQYPHYREYMNSTGMFLPRWLSPRLDFLSTESRAIRWLGWLGLYGLTLAIAVVAALGLRNHVLDSLYTFDADEGVYLSVIEIEPERMADIVRIARSAPAVDAAIEALGKDARLLNYVLPTRMYVSEIPMFLPAGERFGHSVPPNRDPNLYKVVFTWAEFGSQRWPSGVDIVRHAVNKHPLAEIWIDLAEQTVTRSLPPPQVPYYGNRQVPLF